MQSGTYTNTDFFTTDDVRVDVNSSDNAADATKYNSGVIYTFQRNVNCKGRAYLDRGLYVKGCARIDGPLDIDTSETSNDNTIARTYYTHNYNSYDSKQWWDDHITAKTAYISHRTSGTVCETNLHMAREGIKYGARAIELDVVKSLDGSLLWNIHDTTTTSILGQTISLNDEEELNYTMVPRRNMAIPEEPLHQIKDYFNDEYLRSNAYWIIEDKTNNCYTELNALLVEYGLKDRCVIQSDSSSNLDDYKTAGYRTMRVSSNPTQADIDTYVSEGYTYIALGEAATEKTYLDGKGVAWGVYTLNYDETIPTGYTNLAFAFHDNAVRTYAIRVYTSTYIGKHLIPTYSNGLITIHNTPAINTIILSSNGTQGKLTTDVKVTAVETTSGIANFRGKQFSSDIPCRHVFNTSRSDNSAANQWFGIVIRFTDYHETNTSDGWEDGIMLQFTYATDTSTRLRIYEYDSGIATSRNLTMLSTTSVLSELDLSVLLVSSSNILYYTVDGTCATTSSASINLNAYVVFGTTHYISHIVRNTNANIVTYVNDTL